MKENVEKSNQKSMQRMGDSLHNSNDAFVKKSQNSLLSLAGKNPDLKPEAQKFNAYMCNNGENAVEFGSKLTEGLDKKAFPVK